MDSPVTCENYRRFGVEIELNTRTGVVKRPNAQLKEIPDGADYVARLIHKAVRQPVEIHPHHHTHNNNCWIVKPDNSCGIEVCSPVLKGWLGGQEALLRAVNAFENDASLTADERCSLHVHVNVHDLSMKQRATVAAYWIKCEHLFLDAMPCHRKLNRYCQVIGLTDLFTHDMWLEPEQLLKQISGVKYFTMNAFHMIGQGSRDTVEFRIADAGACKSAWYTKNWVRLLLHFVECTKNMPLTKYQRDNRWSGLLWLEPVDLWKILKFDQPNLSHGMNAVRDWFRSRLLQYGSGDGIGLWSAKARARTYGQIMSLQTGPSIDCQEQLFDEKYIV